MRERTIGSIAKAQDEPASEREEQRGGEQAGEIAAGNDGERDVGEAVGDLEQRPEPRQAPSAAPPGPDPRAPAPEAEQDEQGVGKQEAERRRQAEERADVPGGREDVVEPEDIFLEGMGGLGENQQEENAAEPGTAHRRGFSVGARRQAPAV